MTETKRSTLNCPLSFDQVNKINLELAHIKALATIARNEADQSNGEIQTVLMLLLERVDKINSLMQHAWEQSKKTTARPQAVT